MVNYLRQLDRLIEYKEKMNIPDKDIENFLYRAQEKKMYRLVLDNAAFNQQDNYRLVAYRRLLLLTKYSPIKLLNVSFAPLRSIEGFKVDFGYLQYRITKDDLSQLDDVLKWWQADRLKEHETIHDKVVRFGTIHKYTNYKDWEDIESDNYDVMLHANPLLFLFSCRAWFTDDSDTSPREDAPRLADTVKDLLGMITFHDESNAKLDTSTYHITLGYEDMYCIVSAETSNSLKGEHYYLLSFVDSHTNNVIDTLGLRSDIGLYRNREHDVARLILFVMSNINPNAWDDYHLDEHVDHWFTDEKKDNLTELECFFKQHDANRDGLVRPEHGRYRYMVNPKPSTEECPKSKSKPVYVDKSTPPKDLLSGSTNPSAIWTDTSLLATKDEVFKSSKPLTSTPTTSTSTPVTNPVNVSAKALKETEQLWAGDDGNGITLTDAQFKEFLNFLVDKAETSDIESDNPLIVRFHSLLNRRR